MCQQVHVLAYKGLRCMKVSILMCMWISSVCVCVCCTGIRFIKTPCHLYILYFVESAWGRGNVAGVSTHCGTSDLVLRTLAKRGAFARGHSVRRLLHGAQPGQPGTHHCYRYPIFWPNFTWNQWHWMVDNRKKYSSYLGLCTVIGLQQKKNWFEWFGFPHGV